MFIKVWLINGDCVFDESSDRNYTALPGYSGNDLLRTDT